jgi:hypothetical protein
MEVEDEVELAHVSKIPIEYLHVLMDHFESDEFIVARLNAHHKVQARISLVPHLCAKTLELIPDMWACRHARCLHSKDMPLRSIQHIQVTACGPPNTIIT